MTRTRKIQYLIEERLEDANFHGECALLSEGDYEGFMECVSKEFPFIDEFKVTTSTPNKEIKDKESISKGINEAIKKYLCSMGLKTTEVKVECVNVG